MDSLQCDHLIYSDHSLVYPSDPSVYYNSNNTCDRMEGELFPPAEEDQFHFQQNVTENHLHLTMMDYGEAATEDPLESPPPVKQRYQANARERCRTQRCGSQRFLLFCVPFPPTLPLNLQMTLLICINWSQLGRKTCFNYISSSS